MLMLKEPLFSGDRSRPMWDWINRRDGQSATVHDASYRSWRHGFGGVVGVGGGSVGFVRLNRGK